MSVSLPFLGYLFGFLGLDKAPRQGNRPMELTSSFVDLLPQFSPVFTAPTYQTFVAIVAGWVLSQRHRFITEVIFSSGHVGHGHWSRFHRFFSHAAWDLDTLSLFLARLNAREFAVRSGPPCYSGGAHRPPKRKETPMALALAPVASDPLPYVRGLYQLVPEQRLAAILSRAGRASQRRRRLPAESVIWLVIAMALFAADSIPKVGRRLHPTRDEPEPDDSAFTQARRRLGVAPLRQLFLETARPMATHQTIGAFYRGWRLMGLDGTTLDLPDTPENARPFGRPTTGRADGAFPQVRLLALCELGTHAVCGLTLKPICHGEPSMVAPLLDHLRPGMLLIWDRGFFSYELIRSVCKRGAHLLARVKSNTVLRPIRRFADGSYLAKIYPSQADRRRDMRGLPVRVIEYTHDDPNRPGVGERH